MTAYDRIQIARDPERLTGKGLINLLTKTFIELHGDRRFGDDHAIISGIGRIKGQYVTIIAQEKGSGIDERIDRNFGMANPEGYRKVLRLAKNAEKFNRPIITIIDTAGAYPGIAGEERGQGNAIAELLYEFSTLKVPVISILLSEGGSGGAIALGVSDYMYMFENAFYSVISPEGYASILYKGELPVSEVVEQMKIQANDLLEFGVVDEIITEPSEGLNEVSYQYLVENLRQSISDKIKELQSMSDSDLVESRYERFKQY